MKYKLINKKVKTVLGTKQIYSGKLGKQYIKVKGKYYPLRP